MVKSKILGILSILFAFTMLVTVAFVLVVEPALNHKDAKPAQQIENTSGTNWLLVGSDSRVGLSQEEVARLGTGKYVGAGDRTDTIMLLHLPTFGKATLISIPRDSYVTIPGHGRDKINGAFEYGGAALLIETIEDATDLHIDHYAEIDMLGLANMVDAVDGIEVCLDEPLQDKKAKLDLSAGCHTLDGSTALGYVRSRATPMGDLDRVVRQREFLKLLLDKILHVAQPRKMITVAKEVAPAVTVDREVHSWHIARLALGLLAGIDTKTVPFGGFDDDTDVGSVVLWDEEEAAALFEAVR